MFAIEADKEFMRCGLKALARSLGCLLYCCASWGNAQTCEGAQNIRLVRPVAISEQERKAIQAMAPLRVLAVDAPPMSRYDKDSQSYGGVGVDVWCFITHQLGLRYQIEPGREQTTSHKIQQVQNGSANAFMPLSLTTDRARLGHFTLPYYESYYAIIARKGQKLSIRSINDLAAYRVGVVKGVALDGKLQGIVPAEQLQRFDQASSEGLFQALQQGQIDAAVFSKGIFEEKRYIHDYFDLEVINTLTDDPREYRFYFSPSPQSRQIAQVFDRYLAAIDTSHSTAKHEEGERQFIERYVQQRNQRQLWQLTSLGIAALVLILGLGLWHYRRVARLLARHNQEIQSQAQALASANEKLERLSLSDGLTDLANRRAFDQILQREHARSQRTGLPLSVIMADLDHFKAVNDHYGHATGDEYLRAVALVLTQTATRATDLAARYGGEEFACLLPDTGEQSAQALAEQIRAAVARLALPNAQTATGLLTISLGVATRESGQATAQELLEQADAQLYLAKSLGGNCVQNTTLRTHARELASTL